ncbi:hypothetical protein VMCG_00584 [Cytospora schulzeri]|uniref:Uncharacterized protein n=1 Tax=Cytospora schulzeri TaxID=448051 RepID=A0A423X9K8_9PEZI|nr:hypothetical protein VMCG_00584 [Valsa malicola]
MPVGSANGPPPLPQAYPFPHNMHTEAQDNGFFHVPGQGAIRQTEHGTGDFLQRLPTSDVGARPPWRVDPFMGTWPRPHRDEEEVAKRARMTESELIVYEYRKEEERARVFGDDDVYVPWLFPPLGPTQGTATPSATGAQARPSPSMPVSPHISRTGTSRAVPIRRPGDGTAVSVPVKAASSTRRFSKAIPIVRPDDGTIVIPPLLNRTASSAENNPRASPNQAERQSVSTRVVRPMTQYQTQALPSMGRIRYPRMQETSDEGDSTMRPSSASTPTGIRSPTIEGTGETGCPEHVYLGPRSSSV